MSGDDWRGWLDVDPETAPCPTFVSVFVTAVVTAVVTVAAVLVGVHR